MKKIIFGALAAMMLCSCGGDKKATENQSIESLLAERLEKAQTWEDSVIAVNATFMGGYFNYNLHENPQFSNNLDMKEVERGIRQVMTADSTQMSYIYGIRVGLAVLETYSEITGDMPLDKGKFMESLMGALRLDSINVDQLQEMSNQFEQMDREVKMRRQKEEENKIFNTPEAEQNRIMAQSIASTIQSTPDYHQIENTGIYCSVENEGTGELLQPNDRVKVNFTILRLSGEPVENAVEKAMFPARGYNPMLTEVLKYMRHGEKAKFFIPYEYCYGVAGNPNFNIGPCESLFMTVEVL